MSSFLKRWWRRDTTQQPADGAGAAVHATPAAHQRSHWPLTFQYQRPEVISSFLAHSWRAEGHQDALHFPSVQRRDSRLQSIIADYRHRLQTVQAQLQTQAHELDLHLLEVRGIDLIMEAQAQQRMRQIQRMQEEVEKQLELSVDHEGWLVPVLIAYKDGFLTGTRQYQQESDLLGGINTLL